MSLKNGVYFVRMWIPPIFLIDTIIKLLKVVPTVLDHNQAMVSVTCGLSCG